MAALRGTARCACPEGRPHGLMLEGLGNGLVHVLHRCTGGWATFSWHGEHNGGDAMFSHRPAIRAWLADQWRTVNGTVPHALEGALR